MDPLLDELIGKFRSAQDAAVAFLVDVAKMPWPNSNREWSWSIRELTPQITLPDGVILRPHGYGIAVIAEGLDVDFDWGDWGEPDGFDGWRLYWFSLQNCPQIACTHVQLNELLESALAEGSLVKSGSLYFDPNRRARRVREESAPYRS
jgi:hypothetical protein